MVPNSFGSTTNLYKTSVVTTRRLKHDFNSLKFQLCFLNRYIIEISGRLALVRVIELYSYYCNFTPVWAYLITLIFFSTLCSLEQTKTLLSLWPNNCALHVGVTMSNWYFLTKYNVDDFGFKVVSKGKKSNAGEVELSSVLYWILFVFMLSDGFL